MRTQMERNDDANHMPNPGLASRKHLALALQLISLALLVPGLVLPAVTITISIAGQPSTRSILSGIRELWVNGFPLIAVAVTLFSIVVPLAKSGLLLATELVRDQAKVMAIYRTIERLHKWSMAEVFAIGIVIALMTSGAIVEPLKGNPLFTLLLGSDPIALGLGSGFYLFLAYVLLSMAGIELKSRSRKIRAASLTLA